MTITTRSSFHIFVKNHDHWQWKSSHSDESRITIRHAKMHAYTLFASGVCHLRFRIAMIRCVSYLALHHGHGHALAHDM